MEYKDKYGVASLYTDESWCKPSAKIWSKRTKLTYPKTDEETIGVFIDIFPIDGLPKSKFMKKNFYFKLKVCNVMRNSSIRRDFYSAEKYKFMKKILGLFKKWINPRKLAIKMDQMAKRYSFDNSVEVAVSLAIHYWSKETIDKKNMEGSVNMSFEGRKFPVPIGYRRYLENLYGNYMEIPQDAAERGYSHLEGWNIQIFKSETNENIENVGEG
jgi:lipopolysaccharide cholinephosphotransferase